MTSSAVVDEHAAPYQQVDPVWPQWDGARLIAGPLARAAPALWHRGRGCRIYRHIVDNVNNLSTKKEEKRDIYIYLLTVPRVYQSRLTWAPDRPRSSISGCKTLN